MVPAVRAVAATHVIAVDVNDVAVQSTFPAVLSVKLVPSDARQLVPRYRPLKVNTAPRTGPYEGVTLVPTKEGTRTGVAAPFTAEIVILAGLVPVFSVPVPQVTQR